MTPSEELHSILTSGSPWPTDAQDRVRFDAVNQDDAPPYIVLRRVNVKRDYGLDNTLLSQKEFFHVECWGKWREDAQGMEEQVVAALAAEGIVPEPNEPDGLDPNVDVRCTVVVVALWAEVLLPPD